VIEKKAIVTHAENNRVWLKGETASACAGCAQKMGCGTAAFIEAMPKRELEIVNDGAFAVGEEVRITLDDAQLLRAAFLLYLLPLLCMLFGVAGASAFLPNPNAEVWLIPVSLVSLLLGFRLVHRMQRHSAISLCIEKKMVAGEQASR
jgi:sigma-E factor negative regulatory protein RseC